MTKALKIFSKEEMNVIADQAAEKAVKRVFTALDINLADPEDIIRARRDLNFLSEQRKGTENFKEKVTDGAYYGVGLAMLAMAYFSWDIIKAGVKALFFQ